MIPLQMELGGKDSCIILEDADLELAATNIIKGGFSYRFVVHAFSSWMSASAASPVDLAKVLIFLLRLGSKIFFTIRGRF